MKAKGVRLHEANDLRLEEFERRISIPPLHVRRALSGG